MDGSVVIQAVLDTANIPKQVGKLRKSLESVTWDGIKNGDEAAQELSSSLKSAGTSCTVGLTVPIVAAGGAAMATASSYEQATARMRSALGLTAEDAERLGEIGQSIYEDGFGESLDAVTSALITVRENIGEVNDADLSAITEGALTLEATLGMDMTETIRGAGALMKGFGMGGSEAMDLITTAAQRGLNLSDELGDNLAEYATLFQESGYSASEMFSVLEAGLDAGAYNLDKVNDLVKEFGIRIADGSVKEAVGDLGGNFKALYDQMEAGGASNKEMFSALAGEISRCGSEQEKAAAISAIFGSQGEDNGIKVIEAMAAVTDSYGDVSGAAQAAGDAASDTFAAKSAAAMRELQGAVEPLGEPLLNIATMVAGSVRAFGEWFAGIGEGGQMAVLAFAAVAAAIGPALSLAANVVAIWPVITAAFGAFSAAGGVVSTVLGGVKLALTALTGPVGIVIAVLSALTATVVYLWNTNEGFRNAVTSAWNAVLSAVNAAVGGMTAGIEGAKSVFGNAIDAIKGFFSFQITWPHIPLPHIRYKLMDVPLLGKIPDPTTLGVDWYAKGGVFNGPSVIGVGEAGPEAVVPLSGDRMRPFARAIAEELEAVIGGAPTGGAGGQTFIFNQPVQRPDEVARAVRLAGRYGLGAQA